jgi:hypothetical protein
MPGNVVLDGIGVTGAVGSSGVSLSALGSFTVCIGRLRIAVALDSACIEHAG